MTNVFPEVPGDSRRETIIGLYHRYLEAMLHAQGKRLRETMTDGCTLTHMTGMVQSAQDWCDSISDGSMRYVQVQEISHEFVGEPGAERLMARTCTTANIWGTHGTWNLQLEFTYDDASGKFSRIVAFTWR